MRTYTCPKNVSSDLLVLAFLKFHLKDSIAKK